MRTPEQAAQAQLDAYNARDLETFLLPYHEEVEFARLPGPEVFARGHGEMRAIYEVVDGLIVKAWFLK